MMPNRMTMDAATVPNIKNLDGNFILPVITKETVYPGCTGTQVCFSISHSNLKDIPAGSTCKFQIVGVINQESVQMAGSWLVQTQLVGLKGTEIGKYFNIDKGSFIADNFITT